MRHLLVKAADWRDFTEEPFLQVDVIFLRHDGSDEPVGSQPARRVSLFHCKLAAD